MNKKAILALIIGMIVAAVAMAEGPKVGMEFKQQLDAGWTEKEMAETDFDSGTDAVYSRTEMKAKAGFKFGNFSMTPWIKERMEMRLNQNGETNPSLSVLRWRNRFYIGIDNTYKIIDPLSIIVNFEFRVASDLRSNKTGDGRLVSQFRFSPLVGITGEVGGLYYTATEYFHIYTKDYAGTVDRAEEMETELEGFYNVGYTLELSMMKITFDLSEVLGIEFYTPDEDNMLYSTVTAKVIFGIGDISPYIGFVNDLYYNLDASTDNMASNIMGMNMGVGLKKDNVSFGVDYKIGKELEDDEMQSYLSTNIKIKW